MVLYPKLKGAPHEVDEAENIREKCIERLAQYKKYVETGDNDAYDKMDEEIPWKWCVEVHELVINKLSVENFILKEIKKLGDVPICYDWLHEMTIIYKSREYTPRKIKELSEKMGNLPPVSIVYDHMTEDEKIDTIRADRIKGAEEFLSSVDSAKMYIALKKGGFWKRPDVNEYEHPYLTVTQAVALHEKGTETEASKLRAIRLGERKL